MMYLIYASGRMPIEDLSILIEGAMRNQNFFRAIYIIDSTGKTIAVGAREDRSPLHPDYLGIDFSYTPLYNEDVPEGTIVWSDKFISSLSGDTSIGAMMKDRDLTIITELSLDSLLAAFGNISLGSERVWVIDRKGELVIDTADDSEIGIFNVQNIPFMKDAMDNKSVDRKVRFGNHSYYIKYSRSEKLGWLFVIGDTRGNRPLSYIQHIRRPDSVYDLIHPHISDYTALLDHQTVQGYRDTEGSGRGYLQRNSPWRIP